MDPTLHRSMCLSAKLLPARRADRPATTARETHTDPTGTQSCTGACAWAPTWRAGCPATAAPRTHMNPTRGPYLAQEHVLIRQHGARAVQRRQRLKPTWTLSADPPCTAACASAPARRAGRPATPAPRTPPGSRRTRSYSRAPPRAARPTACRCPPARARCRLTARHHMLLACGLVLRSSACSAPDCVSMSACVAAPRLIACHRMVSARGLVVALLRMQRARLRVNVRLRGCVRSAGIGPTPCAPLPSSLSALPPNDPTCMAYRMPPHDVCDWLGLVERCVLWVVWAAQDAQSSATEAASSTRPWAP